MGDIVNGLCAVALGVTVGEVEEAGGVPASATFTLRRDVEYHPGEVGSISPHTWAAPYGREGEAVVRGAGWLASGGLLEEDAEESEWDGEPVVAVRWDRYGVTAGELEELAAVNAWDLLLGDGLVVGGWERLAGYLDGAGWHPAASCFSDGMDWNIGGWSPVRLGVDYVVLD